MQRSWKSLGEWVVGDEADCSLAAIASHKSRAEGFLGSGRIVISNVREALRDALIKGTKLRIRLEETMSPLDYPTFATYCRSCNSSCEADVKTKKPESDGLITAYVNGVPVHLRMPVLEAAVKVKVDGGELRRAAAKAPTAEREVVLEGTLKAREATMALWRAGDHIAACSPETEWAVRVERFKPECCDKWRAVAPKDGDARWLQTDYIYRPIFFCPECGRRL